MITLAPAERDIHRALLTIARSADPASPADACVTYKELGLLIDPDGVSTGMSRPPFRGGLFSALGNVSVYEVERGRPMLSALVVRQDSGTAGPGFADLARHLRFDVQDDEAFWRSELEKVVRFWSAEDPVLLLDTMADKVMAELHQIKAQLHKLTAQAEAAPRIP